MESENALEQLRRYEIVFKSFGGNGRKNQVPIHLLPPCLQMCGLTLSHSKIELYSKQMQKSFFTFGDLLDILQEESSQKNESTLTQQIPSNPKQEEIIQIINLILQQYQDKVQVLELKRMLCNGQDAISETQFQEWIFKYKNNIHLTREELHDLLLQDSTLFFT